jgi:hypothetical protein
VDQPDGVDKSTEEEEGKTREEAGLGVIPESNKDDDDDERHAVAAAAMVAVTELQASAAAAAPAQKEAELGGAANEYDSDDWL